MAVPEDETPFETSSREITEFSERVFSGYDVLMLLELEGIGVGAALHLHNTIERRQANGFYRDWSFSTDLTVQDVQEALARLMGSTKRRAA